TRRTHLRTVSAVGPNFSATETIASHCESQCCSASNTIRTARSRSSTGYFPGLFWSVMTPSSQGLEPARYSGRFNPLKVWSLRDSRGGSVFVASIGLIVTVVVATARSWTPAIDASLPLTAVVDGRLTRLDEVVYPVRLTVGLEHVEALH